MKKSHPSSLLLLKRVFSWVAMIAACFVCHTQGFAQADSTLNNMVLPPDYPTSTYGDLPPYNVAGKGKKVLILIPGLGFDESVFRDFVKANRARFKMYTVTIPGFGQTQAAPAPAETISFGEQTWSNGVLEGLRKLIEQEKLVRPIVVGHFTLGTQLALRMALNFPDKIGGVIVMGGPGKFVPVQSGKVINVPPDKRVMLTDQYMKPFFRTVTKTYWDGNNYMLGLYSLNPEVGQQLWDQVAAVPMPVMIRYLCEFQAEDLTGQVAAIKCPVLVLRPGFKEVWLNDTQNGTLNYIKPQFIDSWDEFKSKNSSFEIKDVAESGVFTWKDQPKITYQLIREFVDGSIR